MTVNHHRVPLSSTSGLNAAAAHTGSATLNDRPTSSPGKPGSATPMISTGRLSIGIVRPTTEGSPPNSRCQNAWLITAVGAQPRESSAAVNNRPTAGRTPSTPK